MAGFDRFFRAFRFSLPTLLPSSKMNKIPVFLYMSSKVLLMTGKGPLGNNFVVHLHKNPGKGSLLG